MDAFSTSPFFAFALVGALVGFIIGDFQRELRLRREVRRNLALAVARTDNDGKWISGTVGNSDGDGNGNTDSGTDGHSHGNGHTINTVRREARSRAVRGDNNGPRAGAGAAGGSPRRAVTQTLIGAGRDC